MPLAPCVAKSNIFYLAMVTKVSARNHGGAVRLKAAASFAESGDIHGVVDELWIGGAGEKKQTLIDTVGSIDDLIRSSRLICLGNRSSLEENNRSAFGAL